MKVRLWLHTKSNPINSFSIKNRNTHLRAVRPGPTRSFHQFNQHKRTPIVGIVVYDNGINVRIRLHTASHLNNTTVVKHKNTHVHTGRPGPMRSLTDETTINGPHSDHPHCNTFWQGNESLIVSWNDRHRHDQIRSSTAIQTHRLLVQNQRNRSVNSTHTHYRHCSILWCRMRVRLWHHTGSNPNNSLTVEYTGIPTYILVVQGQRDRSVDSTKINARRASPLRCILTEKKDERRELMASHWSQRDQRV